MIPTTPSAATATPTTKTPLFLFSKRPGQRANVRFMPGCLVFSLLLSLGLTILLNVLIRLF